MGKIGIVIPAAGQGRRMNREINKQYLQLGSKPILYHTLKAFVNWGKAAEIVVVLHPDEKKFFQQKIEPFFLGEDINLTMSEGGETRKDSVYNGLCGFSQPVEYVMVHDGARPLLSVELIERCYVEVLKHDAVTCGVKVKDTVKIVKDGFVVKTLEREKLSAIQTPQAFKKDLIINAHRNFEPDTALDDASIVEKYGHRVFVVNGEYNNFKITTPEDLFQAELVLKERK